MKVHLTDLSVRSLKHQGSQKTYWDDATPGFGVRVGRHAKTWTIMRGRQRERFTIGRYPELSVAGQGADGDRFIFRTKSEFDINWIAPDVMWDLPHGVKQKPTDVICVLFLTQFLRGKGGASAQPQ